MLSFQKIVRAAIPNRVSVGLFSAKKAFSPAPHIFLATHSDLSNGRGILLIRIGCDAKFSVQKASGLVKKRIIPDFVW